MKTSLKKTTAFLCLLLVVFSCKSAPKYKTPFEIELYKTACYGKCPSYFFTIKDDRSFVFDGKYYTKVDGKKKGMLSKKEYDSVRSLVNQSNFFELEDSKRTGIMDIQFTHLEITEGKNQRKMRFEMKYPPSVEALIKYLEDLAKKKDFVTN